MKYYYQTFRIKEVNFPLAWGTITMFYPQRQVEEKITTGNFITGKKTTTKKKWVGLYKDSENYIYESTTKDDSVKLVVCDSLKEATDIIEAVELKWRKWKEGEYKKQAIDWGEEENDGSKKFVTIHEVLSEEPNTQTK
jgi:hypothetical protein